MSRRVLLVRHTEVSTRWAKKCYGRTDVGLSRGGIVQAAEIAAQLAPEPIAMIIHSGLKRASHLALRLAAMKGIDALADPRWQERHFGSWEGRGWHSIWKKRATRWTACSPIRTGIALAAVRLPRSCKIAA